MPLTLDEQRIIDNYNRNIEHVKQTATPESRTNGTLDQAIRYYQGLKDDVLKRSETRDTQLEKPNIIPNPLNQLNEPNKSLAPLLLIGGLIVGAIILK